MQRLSCRAIRTSQHGPARRDRHRQTSVVSGSQSLRHYSARLDPKPVALPCGAALPPGSRQETPGTFHGQISTLTESIDPHALVSSDLEYVRSSLSSLLGSSNPALTSVATYYFKHPSKQLRPLLVLLFAQATNGLGKRWNEKCVHAFGSDLDWPLNASDILSDYNPNMPEHTSNLGYSFEPLSHRRPVPNQPSHSFSTSSSVLPTQARLAQIAEMIHVASLLHDDVIDGSPLRRCMPSAPAAFGSKLSILTGDFILGRANAALSRLGDAEVSELITCVIANLVEGEVLQIKQANAANLALMDGDGRLKKGNKEVWNIYLKKTFLKTASLMAKCARASVILGGASEGEVWKEVAYAYGRNLGIAFQLVDDILDYEAGEATLGKPAGADLHLGLATGPALFAWEEHPEMGSLIQRKFGGKGDVEKARDLVLRSSGVERTRELACAHADKAREVLEFLPLSDARRALEILSERVIKRSS